MVPVPVLKRKCLEEEPDGGDGGYEGWGGGGLTGQRAGVNGLLLVSKREKQRSSNKLLAMPPLLLATSFLFLSSFFGFVQPSS